MTISLLPLYSHNYVQTGRNQPQIKIEGDVRSSAASAAVIIIINTTSAAA